MTRIAFIGAGQMAGHHLAALGRSRVTATVAGVCDRSADRAQAFAAAASCPVFPTVEALLTHAAPEIVHVCTPPAAHVDAAYAALERNAHVYVEKPFAPSEREARVLLDLAHERGLLVCAGHQLLHDPAFIALMSRAGELGTPVHVDSHFTFRPVGAPLHRATPATLARHLVDILPHPLYALVWVLERLTASRVALEWCETSPTDVQAILRAGSVTGRLSVSLRTRPIASTLTIAGTRGSLTCDFMRSILLGAGNAGTEALEKVLNPIAEGASQANRAVWSTVRRVTSGTSYPGLAEILAAFYDAVAHGQPSPVSPAHLLQVTRLFEPMVTGIDAAVARSSAAAPAVDAARAPSKIVVTGARGFLGAEIARALSPVRGLGRGPAAGTPNVDRWIPADLSQDLAPDALDGVDVVVHAAAEVAGGFPEHQRNSVDATRNLLQAMHTARVRRLVHVSSLSVIEPPRGRERQSEATPRPPDARVFGPYTWGKCAQEDIIEREAAALGIETRIVRPAALLDPHDPEFPGLMGRRLIGRWHLGLGRPGLPIAVIDVDRCADAIAWCVRHFDKAPPIVNLLDPSIRSRADLIEHLGRRGWTGRVIWAPISLLAAGVVTARTMLALLKGKWPEPMKAWSILRPRRYDARLAAALLDAAARGSAALRVAGESAHASDRSVAVTVGAADTRASDTP